MNTLDVMKNEHCSVAKHFRCDEIHLRHFRSLFEGKGWDLLDFMQHNNAQPRS